MGEIFSGEFPDWLAVNQGPAHGRSRCCHAPQGGYAAVALAAFHPDRFRHARSLYDSSHPIGQGADNTITANLQRDGGFDTWNMRARPSWAGGIGNSPNQHVVLLVNDNTRLWWSAQEVGPQVTRLR